MGRKTSRGVIKYAVFKEFNKIMKMLLYHTSKRKIKKTRSFYELCSVVLSFFAKFGPLSSGRGFYRNVYPFL